MVKYRQTYARDSSPYDGHRRKTNIRKENFVQINRADSNLFYTGKSEIDLSPERQRGSMIGLGRSPSPSHV